MTDHRICEATIDATGERIVVRGDEHYMPLDERRDLMASRASAVARLFDRVADHGQSPEEAQQELAADGVDVPAFLARVGQAIDENITEGERRCQRTTSHR